MALGKACANATGAVTVTFLCRVPRLHEYPIKNAQQRILCRQIFYHRLFTECCPQQRLCREQNSFRHLAKRLNAVVTQGEANHRLHLESSQPFLLLGESRRTGGQPRRGYGAGRVELRSCAWCRRYAALWAALQECRDEGDHHADTRKSEVASATTRRPYVRASTGA